MEIKNAKYNKNTHIKQPPYENVSISCEIDGTHVCVPMSAGNSHYAEILKQVDAGDLTIAAAD